MIYTYRPHGVCSRQITVDIGADGVITDIRFVGGCSGNTQGVAALAVGQKAEEIIPKLEQIRCGDRQTSCPAQLAIALKEALKA